MEVSYPVRDEVVESQAVRKGILLPSTSAVVDLRELKGCNTHAANFEVFSSVRKYPLIDGWFRLETADLQVIVFHLKWVTFKVNTQGLCLSSLLFFYSFLYDLNYLF